MSRIARGRGSRPRPMPPIEHGTAKGYRAHLRRQVELCQPCRDAGAKARKDDRQKRARALAEAPKPPTIDGATPSELVLRMLTQLDEWAETTTTHTNPKIGDLGVVVAANVVRLRVSVHNLEKALNRELPRPYNRKAS